MDNRIPKPKPSLRGITSRLENTRLLSRVSAQKFSRFHYLFLVMSLHFLLNYEIQGSSLVWSVATINFAVLIKDSSVFIVFRNLWLFSCLKKNSSLGYWFTTLRVSMLFMTCNVRFLFDPCIIRFSVSFEEIHV